MPNMHNLDIAIDLLRKQGFEYRELEDDIECWINVFEHSTNPNATDKEVDEAYNKHSVMEHILEIQQYTMRRLTRKLRLNTYSFMKAARESTMVDTMLPYHKLD